MAIPMLLKMHKQAAECFLKMLLESLPELLMELIMILIQLPFQ